MRKTGKHAKNRTPEAAHEGTAQPGRPVIWHGQPVPSGTARATSGGRVFRLFRPDFASFSQEASRGVSSAVAPTPNPWLFERKFRLESELGLE